ncbi:hypothetical protein [Bartonella harrusi]|uniref:Uncharacterized protein n=1 Tax=Bartonella harrusi TaxID=2961895 RepID=A0ABY5EWB8_9HYPH|nr:hypothetical protein [Bartonella harrusi]UTO28310.1 hypothetical protein NMK50_09285 [Bartonella harrusi]
MYVEGTLAVIQNEITKLQMVALWRDTEQTLVHQQKYKRNARISNRNNKQIPTVKVQYIKATKTE